MIFEDGNALQQQLYTDLDSLIKIVKAEQQGYLQINDVLSKIFRNKDQLDTNLFICHQITGYRQLVQSIQSKQEEFFLEKRSIIGKYENVQRVEQSTIVLLKRVVYRVLEVVFSSINQLPLKPVNSYQEYIRFKLICQKLLTEVNAQRPLRILKCINEYTSNKLNKSLLTLSIVASNLENGKIQQIDKLKLSTALNKIQQKDALSNQSNPIKLNKSHISQKNSKTASKIKENHPLFKESVKIADKGRFLLQRKAKAVLDTIKDVMEINRQEFLDEFVEFCQENSKHKLLKCLIAKNKQNQTQITQYLTKRQNYQRKISSQLNQKEHKIPGKIGARKFEILKGYNTGQSRCHTARKSLLLKGKYNESRQRTITSEFYRKISKVQECRTKMRKNQVNSQSQLQQPQIQKIGVYQAIGETIYQNQEISLNFQGHNSENHKEKLPSLNKRALSVDQNYKTEQIQFLQNQSKVLSTSTKLADSLKKNCKGEKIEMLPSKIRIELKTVNNFICNEINRKLSKYDRFHRNLCF